MALPSTPSQTAPGLPTIHLLPPPFTSTQPQPVLLTQGAEAIIFRTYFLNLEYPCALKYRPSKPYRHPTLDARLTRHRILSEARTLVKCKREGVNVPSVLSLDWEGADIEGPQGGRSGGWMMMEWIEGKTVKKILDLRLATAQGSSSSRNTGIDSKDPKQVEQRSDPSLVELMVKIGQAVGKMHKIGITHGDLTTSNLMLRPPTSPHVNGTDANESPSGHDSLEGEIYIIDFGLAVQTLQDEDRAVDLYVLERALTSTHPTAEDLFQELLEAYGGSYKGANVALKKLVEVRMRGRKRSMLG
ncbi:MAG: TP53 regulating kinase [Icmadophila ericetorum]|nr:TP53 regulating kinase [Icmadophila ericetorum]